MKYAKKELLINYFTLKNSEELKRDKLAITDDYPFSIFDEPETGLSVKNLFAMLVIINDLTKIRSQFIICTHSPILLAFPNSEIYEIINGSLQKVRYEETDCYNLSKYFLMNYKEMINKLEIQN
jgi:predicted ATPase